jgi:succinate dehydrogenase/fumarate reductase flavoprotein subunit
VQILLELPGASLEESSCGVVESSLRGQRASIRQGKISVDFATAVNRRRRQRASTGIKPKDAWMENIIALEADVVVVGGGGAGMFAAIYAARHRARVILIDKNLVGRGGATIMAQMTCAAALAEMEPDSPELHFEDTLEAGRGLCNGSLAALLCEGSPQRIRELANWRVNWARQENGKIHQVKAPGHTRKRCVYVDFLSTGVAICAALRRQTSKDSMIRVLNNLCLTDLVVRDGEAVGAVGFDIATSDAVTIKANAVILCSGGMMKMFRRTTAPNNNTGDGVGMALRAGARVIDMEFVQFYPNGHLAPRMVGLDPTTWEPTRVKLGGRLLNGQGDEFLSRYGDYGDGEYNTARDLLTHAIYSEVAAGRGSTHGGVYLSFQHLPSDALTAALGPVITIFQRNNIDLTKMPVEVFPIAHYQMGGIQVNTQMETRVRGLYAAGEIVGGANGANRLSGNALPEAIVFGGLAGEAAAKSAVGRPPPRWDGGTGATELDLIRRVKAPAKTEGPSPARVLAELRELMWTKVGAFRTDNDLVQARNRIFEMRNSDLDQLSIPPLAVHNASLVEWFELRNGLHAAEAVVVSALNRRESRGAHQRLDFPQTHEAYQVNQHIELIKGEMVSDLQGDGP